MNRRELIAGAATTPCLPAAGPGDPGERAQVQAVLDRYVGYGSKASGGEGDAATGAWLEAGLEAAGFDVRRQAFQTPFFDPAVCELASGDARAAVRPQALVTPTPAQGVAGRLALVEPWSPPQDLAGRIAVIPLPYARWSTATAAAVRGPVRAATAAGAAALVIVTHGPTGEALALNADAAEPLSGRPMAVLAPRDAAPFLQAAAAGRPGRLTLTGRGGRRGAFNLVGRRDRGRGRWLVVSTPRSGWGVCAGERGGGIAAWLMLASWAARTLPLDLAFLCNSGHEYENLGAEHAVRDAAPAVRDTALWLHLGANVAARDWLEFPAGLQPLPGADSQRVLMASPELAPLCDDAFKGQPGLEKAVAATVGASAGELTPILRAGYPRVLGVFGTHRFHHAPSDDARCLAPEAALRAFAAFREVVARALA